jgi:hypothetical protein
MTTRKAENLILYAFAFQVMVLLGDYAGVRVDTSQETYGFKGDQGFSFAEACNDRSSFQRFNFQ